jgi:LmbE family N-acetylglucosaminyl deacetylase
MKILLLCAHPDDLEFSVPSLIISLARLKGKDSNFNLDHINLTEKAQNKVNQCVQESQKYLFKQEIPQEIQVKVACITRGEMSSFTSTIKSTIKAAKVRTDELTNSQRILTGKEPDFLGLFDAFVRISDDAIERVKDYFQKVQPDIIIAPEPLFAWYHHADHLRTGKIAYFALRRWIQSEIKSNGSGSKQKFPRLFYFQAIWNDWYFPRFQAYQPLIKQALASHVSQKSLLMGAKLPGTLEKIIHGVRLRNTPFGEALRYQPILGRDAISRPKKHFQDLPLVKKIVYYVGKFFMGGHDKKFEANSKNYDGRLKPTIRYTWE